MRDERIHISDVIPNRRKTRSDVIPNTRKARARNLLFPSEEIAGWPIFAQHVGKGEKRLDSFKRCTLQKVLRCCCRLRWEGGP